MHGAFTDNPVTDVQLAMKLGEVLKLLKQHPRHEAWKSTDYYVLGKLVDTSSRAGKAIYKMHADAAMLMKSLKTNPGRSSTDSFAAEKGEVKRLKGLPAVKRFLETPEEYYLDMDPGLNRGLQLQAHYIDAHESLKVDLIVCKNAGLLKENPLANAAASARNHARAAAAAQNKCKLANETHRKVWDKYENLKLKRENLKVDKKTSD